MRLVFDIRMSPGIPLTDQLHRLFEFLVVEDALFEVKRRLGRSGPDLEKVTAAAELTEWIESGKQGVRLLGDDGREEPFMSLLLTKSPRFGSGVRGSLVDGDVATVMHKMHQLLDVVDAYLVRVDGRQRSGSTRQQQAMDANKSQFGGSPGRYWPHYLLCGLSHRTILCDELVEFISADRIAALPSEFAWRENGRQVIAGTRVPVALPTDAYDPQEKAIIEALGATDAFFNPETGELPSRVPELSLARPIRFWDDDGMYRIEPDGTETRLTARIEPVGSPRVMVGYEYLLVDPGGLDAIPSNNAALAQLLRDRIEEPTSPTEQWPQLEAAIVARLRMRPSMAPT